MPFISGKFGQFAYFNLQLGGPVWRGKKCWTLAGTEAIY